MTFLPQTNALGCCTLVAHECQCAALMVKLSLSSRSQTHATESPQTSVWARTPSSSLIFPPPAPSHLPATVRLIKMLSSEQGQKGISLIVLCVCMCSAVELEYSLDLGLTWLPLVRDCLPTSPDCTSYTLQKLLVSDTYNKWGRVTLPIPPHAR